MASEEQQEDISAVIESLKSIFKDVMNEDAIIAVVESCGGDLNQSMDAIMDITNDGNIIQVGIENENKTTESNEAQSNMEKNNPINLAPTYSMALNNPNLSNINQPKSSVSIQSVDTQQQSTSNALASHKHGAVPKVKTKLSPLKSDWTDQLRRIIQNHTKGSRILILMRGAPGSGKTYLAKTIVEMLIGVTYEDLCRHIFSTDDFFMNRGKYVFNKYQLGEAHAWNQSRSRAAMTRGLSPIVIDNTNIETWEMEPYARNAVLNGYIIEVVEPTTEWAKKPNRLAKINSHQVPYNTIKRMIDNYVDDITGESLLNFFKLSYPPDKCPPVYRLIPAFEPMDSPPITSSSSKATNFHLVPDEVKKNLEHTYTPSTSSAPKDHQDGECTSTILHNAPIVNSDATTSYTLTRALNQIEEAEVDLQCKLPIENTSEIQEKILSELNINEIPSDGTPRKSSNACPVDNPTETSEIFLLNEADKAEDELESSSIIVNENQDVNASSNVHNEYLEMQEQYEQFSIEWDNGEKWEDEPQTSVVRADNDTNDYTPKPPRSESSPPHDVVKESTVDGWQQVSLFLPPWNDETAPAEVPVDIPVETVTSGTSIEFGDMDNLLNYKVLETNSRDINLFHIPTQMKIPDTQNLDKSTSTTEPLIMVTSTRCSNEEKHFKALRKMFKNISKTALRDIFDKCKGDVNWAVEILLEEVDTNQIKTEEYEEEISDDEETNQTCSCMSAYQIIPDTSSQPQPEVASHQEERSVVIETTTVPTKKSSKRETVVSEASVELKRQIEQNVVIDAAHYSEHCLKIMRQRRGITETVPEENQPSTSQNAQLDGQDTETALSSDYDEESNASIYGEQETVNITLGKEFVAELDNLFGRTDMTYPDSVIPRINIPVSLLNELNALWIESLTYQLDQLERHREKIIKEDEEFARNLAMKEAELASGRKQPEVLNFKEIMDMELALSLYQKDVALWRNKEPMDMAAKLSREKLFNLFPDVDNDTLAELLMAHDNNFHSTVEVLLISTGKGSILEEEDGVDKFISQNEMQMKQKILEEERKALAEVEWPLLPKAETPDMTAVESYRDQADRHLQLRNKNHQKANHYLSRGMLDVAGYYRSLAEFHKEKFEYNNSLAASSLIQIHAANCPSTATIDLHYFRVGEAKESLDLFIDTHIQTLRAQPEGSNKMRYHTLYCVTGRGAHSPGGPRIKPAIKRRLTDRGLRFNEVNPGLLSTRVRSDSLLTHELPS